MNYPKARHNMIASQVRTWDVSNPKVLDLMETLPREDFTPDGFKHFAYTDMALPLGNGQSVLPPKEQGRILQALNIQPHEKVLEICTGLGYLTALCAQMGAKVVSVDINPALQKEAQKNLAAHRISNVECVCADASVGFASDEPFDVILITGGLPALPAAYKEILNPGGRIFAIIGKAPAMQATLFTYLGDNAWQETVVYETVVPMMQHASIEKEFDF